MRGDLERLLSELTDDGVRYLVVGGVAVVLHGYLRATADLDLVIDTKQSNVDTALRVFDRLGFRPRAPVDLFDFANADERTRWREEKNLEVFSLWHPAVPGFEVDVFVEPPIPFDDAYERAAWVEVGASRIPVVSIDDLIAMKRAAGRPRDREDIDVLLQLKIRDERKP